MNFLKQKYSSKFVLFASIVFLLASFMVLFSRNRVITASLDLSFSTTPTPYPLPTQVYESPSYFITIFGQVFGKKELFPNPAQIIDNGQRQAGNVYLDLYSENNFLPVDVRWWQQESQLVYEYVSKRLGTTNSEKAIVIFAPPQSRNCAPRGTTFHEQQPVVMIFADQDTSKGQILAVLAHELGHVFIHQKYKDLNDITLIEGMATWAAGDYWKVWKGADFNSDVRAFIDRGTYLPLVQNYYLEKAYDDNSPGCIIHRDLLLTEMASFLDFLIQNYGSESLSSLLDTKPPGLADGQRVVYPPNFKGVYGSEFNQLEYEWLEFLLQPSQ